MKKILIMLIILFFNLKTITSVQNVREISVQKITNKDIVRQNNDEDIVQVVDSDCLRKILIESLIYVETTNGKNLFNEKELAIGHLQIRPVMIDDINRIVGYEKYKHEDAWNKKKSIEMFWIYQNYYNPELNLEIAARIWNGGPAGHQYTATLHYWNKVKNKLNEFNVNC